MNFYFFSILVAGFYYSEANSDGGVLIPSKMSRGKSIVAHANGVEQDSYSIKKPIYSLCHFKFTQFIKFSIRIWNECKNINICSKCFIAKEMLINFLKSKWNNYIQDHVIRLKSQVSKRHSHTKSLTQQHLTRLLRCVRECLQIINIRECSTRAHYICLVESLPAVTSVFI